MKCSKLQCACMANGSFSMTVSIQRFDDNVQVWQCRLLLQRCLCGILKQSRYMPGKVCRST